MFRLIITPTSNTYSLQLPDELIGKEVEILAFELNKKSENIFDELSEKRKKEVISFFKKNSIAFSKVEKYTRKYLQS